MSLLCKATKFFGSVIFFFSSENEDKEENKSLKILCKLNAEYVIHG